MRVKPSKHGCRHRQYADEPSSYMGWHEWAERKMKTHYQKWCPRCCRFAIWKPRKYPLDDGVLVDWFCDCAEFEWTPAVNRRCPECGRFVAVRKLMYDDYNAEWVELKPKALNSTTTDRDVSDEDNE